MTCRDCKGPLGEHNTTGRCHLCVSRAWTDAETDRLADLIADGNSFQRAADLISRTKNSCISRFRQAIAKPMGWQAA